MLKEYKYWQNNSGGTYQDGMPTKFTVWADTAEEADSFAENMGVYFDGCDTGVDCSCCGDRWYRAYDPD